MMRETLGDGSISPITSEIKEGELINFYDFMYIAGGVILACAIFVVLSEKGD